MTIAWRLLGFCGLWLIFTGWNPGSWMIGVPSVLLATWAYGQLVGDSRAPSAARTLGFVLFFLRESVRAGVDVASRILRPRMRISPGFQTYRMRLADPSARVLFIDSISLLPGTLSADLVHREEIRVHALDATLDLAPELADLERRVGRLFGEELTKEKHGHV
ncbi:Na+/H+ antiporter subunit E [Thiorhodococcus mannitoliphagus]|uniref:Na+/H+ antiporter subunit E n=1 Tax=Thiorhodococcus mannitoliphagus TaxID=329406 RepID=A0A6P1DL61_9GAMM|nr:Na+/H+ antiporter subunit E [Thiorhodococcus mannitoliphagus]NEX18967.1 Na+/H+ antiporter subunit E [Thiorhodococcus mannitoliphagus]